MMISSKSTKFESRMYIRIALVPKETRELLTMTHYVTMARLVVFQFPFNFQTWTDAVYEQEEKEQKDHLQYDADIGIFCEVINAREDGFSELEREGKHHYDANKDLHQQEAEY